VIGCGRVGRSAAATLLELGAEVCAYDIDPVRSRDLCADLGSSLDRQIRAGAELDRALAEHEYILDASPAADVIDAHHVSSDTVICAPGVPHGLAPGALKKIAGRFLHDPLQIGVATMVIESFFGRGSRND
jgi:pyrrolysine biosynthesis protein PylD